MCSPTRAILSPLVGSRVCPSHLVSESTYHRLFKNCQESLSLGWIKGEVHMALNLPYHCSICKNCKKKIWRQTVIITGATTSAFKCSLLYNLEFQTSPFLPEQPSLEASWGANLPRRQEVVPQQINWSGLFSWPPFAVLLTLACHGILPQPHTSWCHCIVSIL